MIHVFPQLELIFPYTLLQKVISGNYKIAFMIIAFGKILHLARNLLMLT